MEERLVLIDTDCGIDDGWALFLAVAAHKDPRVPFRIVGITCIHGNTPIDNVTVNVTRVLATAEESGIPVYRGSDSALVFPWELGENPWHGKDGFGDAGFPPLQPILAPGHAANAIIQLAEQYKGKLSILALGPLTNLAMAVRLRPNINSMIKEIYSLGGTYQATGSRTMVAEFNFLADAEAAHIVLENYVPCPITIFPWETCLTAYSTFSFRVNTLGEMGTSQITLMNAAEATRLEIEKPKNRWLAPDALLIAIFIDPAVIQKTLSYYCTMELNGKFTRGMMVVDKNSLSEKPPNCSIITDIDQSLYERMIIWAAGGPYYKEDIKA